MTKIKVKKALGGVEEYNLISAFKIESSIYTIFDGEKLGSMGLPIIYVSKIINNKLEKINDANEWQSTKNYLKGIINGTNFEYVKLDSEINGDEAFYTPLTLPSEAALELIKSHYVVVENTPDTPAPSNEPIPAVVEESSSEIPTILETPTESSITGENIPVPTEVPNEIPVVPTIPEVVPNNVETPEIPPVNPVNNVIEPVQPISEAPSVEPIPLTNEINTNYPVNPVMPDNNVISNVVMATIPTSQETPVITPIDQIPLNSTIIPPVMPVEPVNLNQPVQPITQIEPQIPVINNFTEVPITGMAPITPINEPIKPLEPITPTISNPNTFDTQFDNDREMFLKACENMFDALISKYQKKLADLNAREVILKQKENEIDQKLQNASEHLKNAEAREQVANVAHDNAQRVMNLNNFMPTNNIVTNPTSVI